LTELAGLEGTWAESATPLHQTFPGGSGRMWTLPGRRATVLGAADVGLRQVWMHPFEVARDLTLRVDGAVTTPVSLSIAPDQITRHSQARTLAVTERWTLALEHPVVVWEVEAPPGISVACEWSIDLAADGSSPTPVSSASCTAAPDARRVVVRWPDGTFRLIIDVEAGTVDASLQEGPTVRVSVRATGRCRVRLTGVADDADLERSRQMLVRRGFAGMRKQQADHARELATYATSVDVPEAELIEAFEWAKVRMDGLLVGVPGVGRFLVSGFEAGQPRYLGEDASRVALAQLAAGDRNAARDTLKFLSLTQDQDGRVLEECPTHGRGRYSAAGIPPYLLLAAGFAAWSGELDVLARHWAAIRKAVEFAVADRSWSRGGLPAARWARALASLQPLAEALGHPEMAEALASHAEVARGSASGTTLSPFPSAGGEFRDECLDADLAAWREAGLGVRRDDGDARAWAAVVAGGMEGLWGVVPDALAGAVRIAPWFPPTWEAMAVERIRVGRTVLGVRMRRRFGQVAARIERLHGPRMHVEFVLRGAPPLATVQLDDVELGGGRVGFEADGAHALVWHA